MNAATQALRRGLELVFPTSKKAQALADALVSDSEQERLALRAAQDAELKNLRAREMDELARYLPLEHAAAAETAAHRDALGKAIAKQQQTLIEHREIKWQIEHAIARLTAQIEASASLVLVEFEGELRDLLRSTYELRDSVLEKCIDGSQRTTWSNHDSVTSRAAAITAAIVEVRALAMEPLTDQELADRFGAIRAALPTVETRPHFQVA